MSFTPYVVKDVWDKRTLLWGIEVHIGQHYEYYPRNHDDMTPEEQDDWHDDEDMNNMWVEPDWEEFHGGANGSWINALDEALDIIDAQTVIPRPSLEGQAEFLFTDDELSEIWYSPAYVVFGRQSMDQPRSRQLVDLWGCRDSDMPQTTSTH